MASSSYELESSCIIGMIITYCQNVIEVIFLFVFDNKCVLYMCEVVPTLIIANWLGL